MSEITFFKCNSSHVIGGNYHVTLIIDPVINWRTFDSTALCLLFFMSLIFTYFFSEVYIEICLACLCIMLYIGYISECIGISCLHYASD